MKKNLKDIVKETRILKVMFAKDGKGGSSPRITLPVFWLEHMGLSSEDRETEVTYHPRTKKITIRKKSSMKTTDEE